MNYLRKFVLFVSLIASFGVNGATLGQNGWWWNPAESGRGYYIEISQGIMFFATYGYETSFGLPGGASTRPVWYVASGAVSGSSFTGALNSYEGGQSLTGTFKADVFRDTLGTMSIVFADATHATLTIGSNVIPIQRYNIVPNGLTTPLTGLEPQTGWWWNVAESGRGFSLEVQNGTMFISGYMYDTSQLGIPIWYVAVAPMTGNYTLFQGTWLSEYGGQAFGQSPRAPTASFTNGSVTVQFKSTTTGVLTLPNGTQIGITRFNFGGTPTLPTLTVSKVGNGSGTVQSSVSGISCGTTCIASFASNAAVTLTETPATGSTFVSWSGACSGTGSCIVTMNGNQAVTATFNSVVTPPPPPPVSGNVTLTVSTNGTGTGVVSGPGNFSCSTTCSADFPVNTKITLNASAGSGFTFTGWGGACSGIGQCQVTMNANQPVTATFDVATAPAPGG